MTDVQFMRLALRLARRGYGTTSPNPMVGAVLVKAGKIIGRGWHRRAGLPHAEIEAIRDAERKKQNLNGATLFVTLEPCCTHGRTPPCTDAIIAAGIKRVVVAAADPNPKHAGKGFEILKRLGISVTWWGEGRARRSVRAAFPQDSKWRAGSDAPRLKLAEEAARLNEAFNHWIIHRTPFVLVKAAMTLDGKIATASGESKWITGEKGRAEGMRLRQGADAILVGVNTVIADNPALTIRAVHNPNSNPRSAKMLRRIVLDPRARTPLSARILNDGFAKWTTILVSAKARRDKVKALAQRAKVLLVPETKRTHPPEAGSAWPGRCQSSLNLRWLLKKLGEEKITNLLVEGGGETNARFLEQELVQRIAFFYAPKILCGRDARKGVAGNGIERLEQKISLREVKWKKLDADLLLTARVAAD